MSSKFMKFKKVVLPMLTMVVIATQLMGCSSANKQEMNNIIDNGDSEVEIMVADFDSEGNSGLSEDGSTYTADADALTWTKLGDLTNYPELRQALNQYTNEDDTLLTAYQNDQFINALSDTTSLSSTLNYTDLDDTNSYEAVLNVYFDLLPTDKTEFNGEASLTRGQAMTLVTRAVNKVPDGGTPISSENFTAAVGESVYTDFAAYHDKDVYINSKQGLDSENFNAPMTTVEYTYLVVNAVYGESAETEKTSVDSMTFKSSDQEYTGLGAVETIAKYTQNPDAGIPAPLYTSVKIAFDVGAITNNTDLDAAISKTEAINILDAVVKGKINSDAQKEAFRVELVADRIYKENSDILTCDSETFIGEFKELAKTNSDLNAVGDELIEKYKNPDVTESTTTTEAATTTTEAAADAVIPADSTPTQQDPVEGGLNPSAAQQPEVQQPVETQPVEKPVETQPAPVETTPPRVETQPVVTNPPTNNNGSDSSDPFAGFDAQDAPGQAAPEDFHDN